MNLSPFHAIYMAHELSVFAHGADRLIPAYASANIEIFPYQIAAASFALRSPYLKGAILADEGSLGKTYESLLVISELYFEGRDRILIVVPTPLLQQWADIMDNYFSVPYKVVDQKAATIENPFDCDDVVLTTYEFAVESAELIRRIEWNIVVFEEAHRLANTENRTTVSLKEAIGNAFKLLLTATPMQNSIMDLYGLINFINEGCLGDADAFYKRYFRKPENYSELTTTANRYCFRTLRSQVDTYVNIPKRIPVTTDYQLSAKEVKLAVMVEDYLKKPDKLAFPKMDKYDLTLMFTRALSSSNYALCKLADTAYGRIQEPELKEIAELAAEMKPQTTGKGQSLLKTLTVAFAELKKRGANRKVIIFTESRATLGFLHLLLSDTYKTLTFDGSKSTDYSIIKRFEADAEILIATDIAAEGFNLAFCSFVVNYDLPYNTLTIEQRIMRCHRQGQQNDVIVLNFLKKDNFADVRTLELINKRILQFDGIMGRSDDIVGNFVDSATEGIFGAFELARHKKIVETEFKETLIAHVDKNTDIIKSAENALFTTFTPDVSQKVTITPQYIKDRTGEINDKLWNLTKWFFNGKTGYTIDDENKTLYVGNQPQKVFTGAALRRREYSIGDRTLSVTSPIAKNIMNEIFWQGIHEQGTVCVKCGVKCVELPCQMAYYRIKITPNGQSWLGTSYYSFAGKTTSGQVLTNSECQELMKLTPVSFTQNGDTYGDRDRLQKMPSHALDELICEENFIRLALSDTDESRLDEVMSITEKARRNKSELNRKIESLKNELRQIENALAHSASIPERMDAEKRKATASRDMKKQEQSLFMDGLRIDAEAESAIQKLTDNANLSAEITRLFLIELVVCS